MPDIDFQRIVLNLIPKKGDEPVVFYASQYETARPFIAVLMWGDTEFAPGDDCWAEIDIRKNDDNLVVLTDDVAIDNNEVSVILPVQALTCIGKNLGQVKIYAGEDQLIAALNFILEVQADPLAGGVTSETAIDNLTEQIEEITQQVIGDDYYNKTEVDGLLADKADQATTYTKSEVDTALDLKADKSDTYTKTQTDNLLNNKADKSDTYTKTQVDSALALKANSADLATVATTGDYDDLINKPVLPDMTQYYTKSEVDALIDNIYPTVTASGPIASFTTALTKPLVSVIADPLATTITRCGVNLFNEIMESGSIDNTNGQNTSYGTNRMRSKNYIPVKPGTSIYFLSVNNVGCQILKYGADKTYLGTLLTNVNVTMSIPLDCYFIRFRTADNYGTAYNNDIGINYPSTDTTYHAYNGNTAPIADATTLVTQPGINNVFADVGDVTVQYKYMSM